MSAPLEIPDGPIGDDEAVELVERLVYDRMAELRSRAASRPALVLVIAPDVLVLRAGVGGES